MYREIPAHARVAGDGLVIERRNPVVTGRDAIDAGVAFEISIRLTRLIMNLSKYKGVPVNWFLAF
jgi:hypothetical protein